MNAVIIGCSNTKNRSGARLPAIELYQGNTIPELRSAITGRPELRGRIFILSGRYGVLGADDPIEWYDHNLTLDEAIARQGEADQTLKAKLGQLDAYPELLVLAAPTYFAMISGILLWPDRPVIHWLPDPGHQWDIAETILSRWKWTHKP